MLHANPYMSSIRSEICLVVKPLAYILMILSSIPECPFTDFLLSAAQMCHFYLWEHLPQIHRICLGRFLFLIHYDSFLNGSVQTSDSQDGLSSQIPS